MDILGHLKLPLELKTFRPRLAALEERKNRVLNSPLTASQVQQLSLQRIFSSNSLARCQKQRERWDLANHAIMERLSTGEELNLAFLIEINSRITAEKDNLRKSEIYAADLQFQSLDKLPQSLSYLEKLMAAHKYHPLEKAFRLMQAIISIHPFKDGNGRSARLFADAVLLQHGYSFTCFRSSVAGHVAVGVNKMRENLEGSFHRFLAAVENSYDILEKDPSTEQQRDITA